jgi:hypothetical protein
MNKVYYSAWLVSGKLKKFPTRQVLAQSEYQGV